MIYKDDTGALAGSKSLVQSAALNLDQGHPHGFSTGVGWGFSGS